MNTFINSMIEVFIGVPVFFLIAILVCLLLTVVCLLILRKSTRLSLDVSIFFSLVISGITTISLLAVFLGVSV
jgi:hypothetical protein